MLWSMGALSISPSSKRSRLCFSAAFEEACPQERFTTRSLYPVIRRHRRDLAPAVAHGSALSVSRICRPQYPSLRHTPLKSSTVVSCSACGQCGSMRLRVRWFETVIEPVQPEGSKARPLQSSQWRHALRGVPRGGGNVGRKQISHGRRGG